MPRDPKASCPFIESPAEECYVTRMESWAIARTIHFCGGKYEQCWIYRMLAKKRRQESRRAGESGSMSEPERSAENQE